MICDGHGSHFTLEVLDFCRANGIVLILRPPHTSHVTQCEDIINFRILKPLITYRLSKIMIEKKSRKVGTRYENPRPGAGKWASTLGFEDLLYAVSHAWREAFSEANCLLAWDHAGLRPFNRMPYHKVKAETDKRVNKRLASGKKAGWLLTNDFQMAPFVENRPAPAPQDHPAKKTKRFSSALLWDQPGGVCADAIYAQVKQNHDVRQASEDKAALGRVQAKEKASARQDKEGEDYYEFMMRYNKDAKDATGKEIFPGPGLLKRHVVAVFKMFKETPPDAQGNPDKDPAKMFKNWKPLVDGFLARHPQPRLPLPPPPPPLPLPLPPPFPLPPPPPPLPLEEEAGGGGTLEVGEEEEEEEERESDMEAEDGGYGEGGYGESMMADYYW